MQQSDLTQGPILKKLLHVAVPIMGTQLLQMAYNLTDMAWLGRLPGEGAIIAQNASGLGGMFLWLSMALLMFGRMGAEIGVSQNLGRGDRGAARRFCETAVSLSVMLGVFYGLLLFLFPEPLVRLFNSPDPRVLQDGVAYLRIVGIGIPFTYVTAAITGVFNGAGNSRLGFWCNFIGLGVNMVLDPIMIFTFGWGIKGAAIATVIAQGVVCVLFVVFLKKHKGRPFDSVRLLRLPRREEIRQIARWSTPVAVESALFTLLAMVVTRTINTIIPEATLAITVQRIANQIESMSWLIGGGFASALTAFVGQNFGAQKWDRIRQGHSLSLLILTGWQVFVAVILLTLGGPLFALFIPGEPEVHAMGAVYLMILAACEPFMGLEGACAGTLRGMGKTVPPLITSVIGNVLRVPLCYFMGLHMGINGIWWGISISAALKGVLIGSWFYVGERALRNPA